MSDAVLPHDLFLSHSAKDQSVAHAVVGRFMADGLRLRFDGGGFPVAASRQSAAISAGAEEARGEKVSGALPRRRYACRSPADSPRLRLDPWAVACPNGAANTGTPTNP